MAHISIIYPLIIEVINAWYISWFCKMFSLFYYSSLIKQPIGCNPLQLGHFRGFINCSPFRTKLAQKGSR